ncbi:MAG: hypothetical protein FJ313_02105 [Gemmatimonadetes bacterium]|nr:hypothetical protein [Gemmatimonadota bacterium]
MAEQVVHVVLLALHNIALVGCAAAPFYNRQLVLRRAPFGPKLYYELDRVVEDTLQGNMPYCLGFITVLWLTGLGMPLSYLFFHGELREVHVVAIVGLAFKLLFVVGMMVIMLVIFAQLNPRLRELLAGFSPGAAADAAKEAEFFANRAHRKKLCEVCLGFAVAVLLFSALLGFQG